MILYRVHLEGRTAEVQAETPAEAVEAALPSLLDGSAASDTGCPCVCCEGEECWDGRCDTDTCACWQEDSP